MWKRMVRAVMVSGAVLSLTAGCVMVGLPRRSERDVIRGLLGSSVQVVIERRGDRVRSGSGVVIRARPDRAERTEMECLVLTSGHTFASMKEADDTELYVLLDRHLGAGTRARAELLKQRETDEVDLALLRIRAPRCLAARTGLPPALGDRTWIAGFPWGRQIRLITGIVSQVSVDDRGKLRTGASLMVDASVVYGMSGSGVFDATGRLVGLIEGYGTARVSFGERTSRQYVDVPVAGETYVTSLGTIERFLRENGSAP
jgi:S1-C subfamily serine protease